MREDCVGRFCSPRYLVPSDTKSQIFGLSLTQMPAFGNIPFLNGIKHELQYNCVAYKQSLNKACYV